MLPLLSIGTLGARTAPTWQAVSPMNEPRTYFAAAATREQIFVMGGWHYEDPSNPGLGHYLNSTESFAPGGQWAVTTAMGYLRAHDAAAALNDTVYHVGSAQSPGGVLKPGAKAWTPIAPTLVWRNSFTAAALGDSVYITGGTGGDSCYDTVEAYDPRSDTWTMKASMHYGRCAHASAVYGGRMFVAGGDQVGVPALASVEAYDPATDSWAMVASMARKRTNLALASVGSVGLFALGGCNVANKMRPCDSVEVYDPAQDRWADGPALLTARAFSAAVTLDGAIYVIGGQGPDFSSILSSVEKLTPVAKGNVV